MNCAKCGGKTATDVTGTAYCVLCGGSHKPRLVLDCKLTRYETDKPLEAVGVDAGGQVKPIMQISYGPCGYRNHAADCDCGGVGGDR